MNISDKNLLSICKIISKKSGLHLNGRKNYGLTEAISTAFLSSGCNTIDDYISLLSAPSYQSRIELDKLISLLTVKETYFFRDKHQFEVLKKIILPEIISKKIKGDKKIRIWSAGCATGEEAYSLGITLFELVGEVDSWDISILATDIDTEALMKAQKGEYHKWSFRGVSEDVRGKYFIKDNDVYRINDIFRGLINFSVLNLKEDNYPLDLDIIMCRNVTIYFDKNTTKEVIGKFYDSINEGGYLFVGHSEHSSEYYKKFFVKAFPHTIIYQKSDASQEHHQKIDIPFKQIQFREAEKKPIAAKNEESEDLIKPTVIRQPEASEETNIFQEAVQLFMEDKYDAAAERLVEILELNPKNVRACVILAQIFANRGDMATAVRWCEEAIKIDNLNREAYYLMSLISEASGDLEKAVSLLKKVVYINSDFVLGYFHLGRVYKQQNKDEKAKRCFENAKDLLRKDNSDKTTAGLSEFDSAELLEAIDKELGLAARS